MTWLKEIVIDLVVTALIVLAVVQQVVWAEWIVLIYTPFMLALKALAFFAGGFIGQFKRGGNGVPPLFYHIIYAINVAVLVIFAWWGLAAQWAAIWIISIGIELKARPHLRATS